MVIAADLGLVGYIFGLVRDSFQLVTTELFTWAAQRMSATGRKRTFFVILVQCPLSGAERTYDRAGKR